MKCNPDLDGSRIHEHHLNFKTPTEYLSAQSEALRTRKSALYRREK